MSARAGAVKIQLSVESASYSQSLDKAKQQLDQLAGGATRAGHSTVSSMQASSAALRELNGDFTNNIRAVERFIGTIPGISTALQAAFPLVGAIALAGLFVEMGTKAAAFVRQINEVPTKIRDAFAEINTSAQLSNDSLRLVNDTLANDIAKLEHKPQNSLAIALDESRIAADKLAISLDNDYTKVTELLKANRVGFAGTLLGKGSTADVSGNLRNFENQFRDAGSAVDVASHSGDKAGEAAARQRLAQLQQNAIAYANSEYAKRSSTALNYQKAVTGGGFGSATLVPETYAGAFGDQSANLAALSGFRGSVYQSQDQQVLEAQHSALKGKDEQLKGAKDLAESQSKADELRLKALEDGDVKRQLLYGKNVFAEEAYWASLTQAFRSGSSEYDAVQKKQLAAREEAARAELEVLTRTRQARSRDAEEMLRGGDIGSSMSRGYAEDVMHSGSRYTQFRAEQFKASMQSGQDRNALDSFNLAQGVATGTVSKYGAAAAEAGIHSREYADALAELQSRLSDLSAQGLSPEQYQTQAKGIQNELDKLGDSSHGSRALQIIQDNSALDSTTFSGSTRTMLNEFVQQSQDTASQVKQIFTEALSSINGSLSSSLTAYAHTDRQYWRQVRQGLSGSVRGIGGSILNTGMQKAEGAALGALGFGAKADGSQANPLWVRIAGTLGSAGSGVRSAGSLLSGLFGGSKSSGTGGSDPLGLIAPGAVDAATGFGTGMFQGFFAGGGDVVANRPAIIGEKGPEMFVPKTAGTIIPNNHLDMGDTHHHWNVNASGSGDPAATHAAVMRGIREAAPHIIAASNAARTERNRRMPSSQRV